MTLASSTSGGRHGAASRFSQTLQGVSFIARSGIALISGSVIGAALGMVFWAVGARLLSQEQMGVGAALVAALTTLGHASQLNLRNVLHRFVPGAGAREARLLIRRAYVAAATLSIALGTGFAVLAPTIAPELALLGLSPVSTAGFAAALMIWTLYSLQEAALTALRLASYVPAQTLVYSIGKIGCIVALAMLTANGATILVAWVAPALVVGLVTHFVARGRVASRPGHGDVAPGWRQLVRFLGWDYVGALATSISLGAAPLLVVSLAGAEAVAPYYLAWSITYILYLVARNLGAAMLAELGTGTGRRGALYAETIVLTLLPVTGGALFLVLLAPQVMLLFGASYSEAGASTLATLALASIPGALVTIYLSICRAEGRVRMIALLQVAILLAVVFIGAPLTAATGPTGMALGWLAANSIAALILFATEIAHDGRAGVIDFAVELVSAGQSLLAQARNLLPARGAKPAALRTVEFGGRSWLMEGPASPSLSDALTLKLTSADAAQFRVIAKHVSTDPGRSALCAEYINLRRMHRSETIRTVLGPFLPVPLSFDGVSLLTTTLPGEDCRKLARHPTTLAPVLAQLFALLADAGERTATSDPPSPAWFETWIDAPLSRLGADTGGHSAVAAISQLLHAAFEDRDMRLGLGHGDCCPDNMLVTRDPDTDRLQLSGIVDWAGLRADAPCGLDACMMAITVRAGSTSRQFGQVVADLLAKPEWTDAEHTWLGQGQPWLEDPEQARAMVLLAWLQHVDANIGKSARYTARNYWGLANVWLVLEAFARVRR